MRQPDLLFINHSPAFFYRSATVDTAMPSRRATSVMDKPNSVTVQKNALGSGLNI
jgi:hypothetical protein